MANSDPVVSFADEQLILVDSDDREIGFATKAACHAGEGRLHRAFSVFLFNETGELLMHQRSGQKELWPGFWTNSCCSHPRRGEEVEAAAKRRVAEELGVEAELRFLFKFEYQASFADRGAEHELCWVFVGRASGEVQVNQNEISAWRFVAPQAVDEELRTQPDRLTPWLKIEWPRLRADYWPVVVGG